MKRSLGVLLSVVALTGCAMEDSPDAIDAVGVIPGGKADGGDYSACELGAVVSWLNEGADADALSGAGVHARAARNLVEHRDGADGAFGTADDDPFDDIAEVDAVYYVGPVAIQQLVAAVAERCVSPEASEVEVIFSPQAYEDSHLARVAREIDGAARSIDVAMYSFRDAAIMDALRRAVDRGVTVRFIFQSAYDDRSDPAGTASATLEDIGIEVRWINKIMHHKYAIIDGARSSLDEAGDAVLLTGSGNWSHSAGTRYDENTVIVRGNVELALRYQREFNHLWDNGRLFERNESIPEVPAIAIEASDIPDEEGVDALFTSANFRVYDSSRYGPTFTVDGRNEVADRFVELIRNARSSIRIASGHLRSRPISDALLEAVAANPELDVRIYLDGQEYISEWAHYDQERELEQCLVEAGDSAARQQDCTDRGFLFSYALHQAGIPLRFKHYSYRWHYSYADQMHHKYMIVDEQAVVTGSYNLSDNAEHNTMENVVIFDGPEHRSLVEAFVDNFDAMWVTGEAEGRFDALLDEIENGTEDFPIVYPSMALDWEEVTILKEAIREHCALINSEDYRQRPERHRYCDR